jgi:S1-C subfamily serine protease
VEGLSAQRAGLRQGDEIVAVDGRPINRSFNKLVALLEDYRRGDVIPVMVIRAGVPDEIEEVDVTLSGWEDISDFAPQIWGR